MSKAFMHRIKECGSKRPDLRVSGVGCQVSGEISMGHRAWSIGYKHFEIIIAET
jgi:hypothetical protein